MLYTKISFKKLSPSKIHSTNIPWLSLVAFSQAMGKQYGKAH